MFKYKAVIVGIIITFAVLAYFVLSTDKDVFQYPVSIASSSTGVALKEYKNKTLGFAIYYPIGWSSSKENAGLPSRDYTAITFSAPELRRGIDNKVLPNIAVNYYRDLNVLLSFEKAELKKPSLEVYLRASQVVRNVTPVYLAGLPAWKGSLAGPGENDVIDTIFVEHNGHVFAIGVSNRNWFDKETEKAMIESFRFEDDK